MANDAFGFVSEILKVAAIAIALSLCLFADAAAASNSKIVSAVVVEITAVCCDPGTQWWVFISFLIYIALFLFLRFQTRSGFWHARSASPYLSCLILIGSLTYLLNYSPSAESLVFIVAIVLSQGIAFWSNKRDWSHSRRVTLFVITLFVILLTVASIWNVDTGYYYEYHNHNRWSGPWSNPNLCGLLMGTGVILAIGQFLENIVCVYKSGRRQVRSLMGRSVRADRLKLRFVRCGIAIVFLFASILMARGLLNSYSRGAWFGTGCGLAYLFFASNLFLKVGIHYKYVFLVRAKSLAFSLLLFAIFTLSFFQLRQVDSWRPLQRMFSAVDTLDFSWRNRIAALNGAAEITAEHSWAGVGWSRPELLYEHYYVSPKLVDGEAIEMNDYLMLVTTLGVPALFCFGMYLWLALSQRVEVGREKLRGRKQRTKVTSQNPELVERELLKITCRGGAIVLLVGFWFDGGLFKLATASTFWILLELGNVQNKPRKETN